MFEKGPPPKEIERFRGTAAEILWMIHIVLDRPFRKIFITMKNFNDTVYFCLNIYILVHVCIDKLSFIKKQKYI